MVFISYSSDDRPILEDVVDALGRAGVPNWSAHKNNAGGESLREHLRAAIDRCTMCIFIATHRSVSSSWCTMEIGAFWGAGKPIIVYLADTSLDESDLPPVVQGNVHLRSLRETAERASRIVRDSPSADDIERELSVGTQVGAMTAGDLFKVVTGAVSLVLAGRDIGRTTGGRWTAEQYSEEATDSAIREVEAARKIVERTTEQWRKRILWVSDRPADCVHEREAFTAVGLAISLAQSLDDAAGVLQEIEVAVVVANLSWHDNRRLLDVVQASGNWAPTFVYARSPLVAERRHDAVAHGAHGTTDAPNELLDMVTRALVKRPPRSPKPSA